MGALFAMMDGKYDDACCFRIHDFVSSFVPLCSLSFVLFFFGSAIPDQPIVYLTYIAIDGRLTALYRLPTSTIIGSFQFRNLSF